MEDIPGHIGLNELEFSVLCGFEYSDFVDYVESEEARNACLSFFTECNKVLFVADHKYILSDGVLLIWDHPSKMDVYFIIDIYGQKELNYKIVFDNEELVDENLDISEGITQDHIKILVDQCNTFYNTKYNY